MYECFLRAATEIWKKKGGMLDEINSLNRKDGASTGITHHKESGKRISG
jgi:hypothetical protein